MTHLRAQNFQLLVQKQAGVNVVFWYPLKKQLLDKLG
jgi:hypothetical protein